MSRPYIYHHQNTAQMRMTTASLHPIPQAIMRRLYPPGFGRLSDLQPTGPSPVLARLDQWVTVADRWEGFTAQARRMATYCLPKTAAIGCVLYCCVDFTCS